ncbi:hypothetical protein BDQ12DRAFT_93549 [Crucibulum laeve]|uniref:Uncharacterized protein n=1 Tax=Crucibulum laeve TaxID=68775 RepID=A0A5C3LGH7_9AGAR|nr:hypothetical protein BDQ12DRAFT_93549 [Crucibulum laeve]
MLLVPLALQRSYRWLGASTSSQTSRFQGNLAPLTCLGCSISQHILIGSRRGAQLAVGCICIPFSPVGIVDVQAIIDERYKHSEDQKSGSAPKCSHIFSVDKSLELEDESTPHQHNFHRRPSDLRHMGSFFFYHSMAINHSCDVLLRRGLIPRKSLRPRLGDVRRRHSSSVYQLLLTLGAKCPRRENVSFIRIFSRIFMRMFLAAGWWDPHPDSSAASYLCL